MAEMEKVSGVRRARLGKKDFGPFDEYIDSIPMKSEKYISFLENSRKLSEKKSIIPLGAIVTNMFMPVNPKKERPFYKEWERVSILGNNEISLEIYKKFHQLDQNDLNFYLWLIKIAGPDMIARFTRYQALKFFGKDDCMANYTWIMDSLDRMGESRFCFYETSTINGKKKTRKFFGPLVSWVGLVDDIYITAELVKPLAALLENDSWSFIDMELRKKIGNRRQKALAFHAWLSVNKPLKKGIWVTKEQLKAHFSSNKDESMGVFIRNFRRDVIDCLLKEKFLLSVEEKDTCFGFWHSSGKKKVQKD